VHLGQFRQALLGQPSLAAQLPDVRRQQFYRFLFGSQTSSVYGISILSAIPGLPHLPERLGEPRKGRSNISARLHLLGSRIALAGWICNCAAAKNVVFGGKGGIHRGENVNGILG
jgi:hypothetical protein